MEQGCPHRSILPHIFPDCNSFAIKIGGKFCGVRGVCPGGGLPRRCRRGGRQRYPAGACPLCRLPALPLRCPRGSVPALSPAYPAFRFLFCPLSPRPPSPVGKGVTIGYFMQGASPLAFPGLNPRGTGSPCRCGKLNGGLPRRCRRGGRQRYPAEGLASALPARRASAIPGGGLPSLPPAYPATVVPAGGVPALSPAYTAFNLLPCPHPPRPPSRREGGDYRLFFARGFAPCIPRAEPGRHWSRGRTTHPAGVCLRNRQLAAKPIEQPFYWQCRQPRRGGTGGEELRRLRWFSPPGQG